MTPRRIVGPDRERGSILIAATVVVTSISLVAVATASLVATHHEASVRHQQRLRTSLAADGAARWITVTFPAGSGQGCEAVTLPPDPEPDLSLSASCFSDPDHLDVTVSARTRTHHSWVRLEIIPDAGAPIIQTDSANVEPLPARTSDA